MTMHLVQATMSGREYTHYTCRTEAAAIRLAAAVQGKRPNLCPVRVVPWEPTPEQFARITRFADESTGPK